MHAVWPQGDKAQQISLYSQLRQPLAFSWQHHAAYVIYLQDAGQTLCPSCAASCLSKGSQLAECTNTSKEQMPGVWRLFGVCTQA